MDERYINQRVNAVKRALEDQGIDFEFEQRNVYEAAELRGQFGFLFSVNDSDYTINFLKVDRRISVIHCPVIDRFEFDSLEQLSEIVLPHLKEAKDVAKRYALQATEKWDIPKYGEGPKRYSVLLTETFPPLKNAGNLVDAVLEYERKREMIDGGA